MKYQILVTRNQLLGVDEFIYETDLSPETPYAEWVKKSGLEAYLAKNYPDRVCVDINMDLPKQAPILEDDLEI
jgi:trans-aconitate methyltransferase